MVRRDLFIRRPVLALALACLTTTLPALAGTDPAEAPTEAPPDSSPTTQSAEAAPTLPVARDRVEVTATRVSEDVEPVPVSISVVTGDELRSRGVHDLQGALSLVAGVTAAPGGDAGPAGSVPELWGLREMDAFLLVVDGVPWGGAFNPALPSLDLVDVERIEVLRGAAPVFFGATSFVGVIQVVHRAPGEGGPRARVWGGTRESGGGSWSSPLPEIGSWKHSLTADVEQLGFADDRQEVQRGHVLYRSAVPLGQGRLRIDVDAHVLRQDPGSPHPREGTRLSDRVPVDANHNPRDARLDEDRWQLTSGYERPFLGGEWSTTLAVTHTERDNLRGFLTDLDGEEAVGYEQTVELDDLYFDTHVAWRPRDEIRVVAGLDTLAGKGTQESVNFHYDVDLDGSGAPGADDFEPFEATDLEDERTFGGLYVHTEWTPTPRWRVDVGARLNHTAEDREGEAEPLDEEEEEGEEEGGSDSRTETRLGGQVGVSYLAWSQGSNGLWLFADYRDTYKPGAIDFGPEAESEILEPETAESWEAGVKAELLDGRWRFEASLFRMDFSNLVLSQAIDGLPTLVNAGEERFEGVELESEMTLAEALHWRLGYSYHDARFQDYERLFDGVPFRLNGNRLELSARHMASTGILWAPPTGFRADLLVDWVGARFLDKRNRAEAGSYAIVDAGVGYRTGDWEIRLDGRNLGDRRDPVAESEFGDAQYYLQPARSATVSLIWTP